MSDPINVTLAGADYKVGQPLTLQQLIDVRVIVYDKVPKLPEKTKTLSGQMLGEFIKHKLDVVAAGLKADNPDLSAEKLAGMRITENELQAAYVAIVHLAGLQMESETAKGEVKPAA